jgi:uncharacterized protein YcgL (UPF0745 family)
VKADIYRTGKKDTYLFTPQGGSFSAVPQVDLDKLGTLQFWKTIDLAPNILAANPERIEMDFKKQGYSIVQSGIDFRMS